MSDKAIVGKGFNGFSKHVKIYLSLLLLIIVSVLTYVLIVNNHNKVNLDSSSVVTYIYPTRDCTIKSTDSVCAILQESSVLLQPKTSDKLQPYVTKIIKVKDYQNDPNLVYVLLTYSINTTNGQGVKNYYTLLLKDYNTKYGYNIVIKKYALLPVSLKATVDTIYNNYKQSYQSLQGNKVK